ncbi:hypothetical protein E0H35_30620 [Rhizobium leguminosarum bv. viciae]|uniref:hypothetical protein n=1 Tax=Rhizobium leguminosarum TaxID=384 RepID=UPI00103AD6BE|nr:hypothetical protein [Rhizobium leguminosarum]MBY5340448.1 hypothetical protein [Rhizobium leguminosarum]NKK49349.1 hypothetical protein [Rhizobium leguminosarum bv. viciae]TBY90888.1 hypothetical protein E0H35_30620 [Rhizobium leguminosarum bv. viciae]
MPAKSEEIRNRKQRERQQKLRDADRKARRPGRDDVARTVLFMTMSSMAARGRMNALARFQDVVVSMLVRQGFDEHASRNVFDELVEKYRDRAWPFRRKPHLLFPDGADRDG